MLFIKIVVIT